MKTQLEATTLLVVAPATPAVVENVMDRRQGGLERDEARDLVEQSWDAMKRAAGG